MNGNTSPIAFYPNRASQPFRANYRQKEIATICGNDLPPFYIYNVTEDAPETCELYDANTDVKVADLTCSPHLLTHTTTLDGKSVKMWIFQGTQGGIFGNAAKGYFYLKIGSYYSDIFKIGELPSEYVKLEWQVFDDIITADGSLISKYVVYKQIFNVPLWHPEYSIEEEGKTNNGIYFAMQQTTKKTSGFSTIVNEAQCDVLSLIAPLADSIKITSCVNGQTKEMRTNRFEIKSKWQSDDVTHIECEFDLMTIIRKYQQSENAPEPLPIDVPPTPPGVYKIKGYSNYSVNNVTLKINGSDVILPVEQGSYTFTYTNPLTSETITEAYDHYFEYTYNEPLTSFETGQYIRALDFGESCNLISATSVKFNKGDLDYVNAETCTFASLTTGESMFNGSQVQRIYLPQATFANVTNAKSMFNISPTHGVLWLVLPQATFANVTNAELMFYSTTHYTSASVQLPLATFEKVTTATNMFQYFDFDGKTASFPSVTFAALKNCTEMFQQSLALSDNFVWSTFFPSCTMEATTTTRMFYNASMLYIDLSAINIRYVTNAAQMFQGCGDASTIAVGNGYWHDLLNGSYMFYQCKTTALATLATTFEAPDMTNAASMFGKLTNSGALTFTAATFGKVTNVEKMFEGANVTSVSMPEANFINGQIKNANNMFYNCTSLTSVSMPKAKFSYLNADGSKTRQNLFSVCSSLASVDLSINNMVQMNINKPFELEIKLPALTKASFINIMDGTAAITTQSNQPKVVILQSWLNSFSLADKSIMLSHIKTGWTYVLE